MPKRLRWYLAREPAAVSAVLHLFLRVIESHLRQTSDANSAHARLGTVSFIHRFGSSLNRHINYHFCVIGGVFDAAYADGDVVRFRVAAALMSDAATAIPEQVRIQVLGNSMSGLSD